MSKFKFPEGYTSTLPNFRVTDTMHHKIKSIASKKNVTMQDVIRTMLEFAIDEFEKEYEFHFLHSDDPNIVSGPPEETSES